MNKHGRPLLLTAHDSIAQLKDKIKASKDEAFRVRLRAIVKAFEGKTQRVIAEELAVCARGISAWIRKYRAGGTDSLRTKSSGRPIGHPKWDPAIFTALTRAIDQGGYWSIPRMQEWIAKNHHVHIPEQTIWFRLDALQYSYKSARPHPAQGNREKQETFKKGVSVRSWSR